MVAKKKKNTVDSEKVKQVPFKVIDRDLSWLSFNDRVLQEAADERVPLIERLRFLGIFSNNLDEFFRVRVGTLRRMASLPEKALKQLEFDPKKVLNRIRKAVIEQQQRFELIFQQILKELKKKGIRHVNETELTPAQSSFVRSYFAEVVRPALVPVMLDRKGKIPELRDRVIYFAIHLKGKKVSDKNRYSIIEIPSQVLPRFLVLPRSKGEDECVIFLDDVIRHCLDDVYSIFDHEGVEAFTVKVTRDAELDLEKDLSKSMMEKISKSVKNRMKGEPVRFVYDKAMSQDLLEFIMKRMKVEHGENVIPGGRYHNFRDFIQFPTMGKRELVYDVLKPLEHPFLVHSKSIFEMIRQRDVMLSYPYQSFNYIIDLLREAAIDPQVKDISINLYRVANQSKIINALINAVQNGKAVKAVIELQARFDEENNIKVANKLQEAGIKVVYGVPGLKVHSKLILISRKEPGGTTLYAHVGTGNFHERNALVYGDHSLLTADPRISREVAKVFRFFDVNFQRGTYRHLFVSPFNTRKRFIKLIDQEIKNARKEKDAYIIIKLNNLVDDEMIEKLYEASCAGVKIQLVIRGICCLIPGVKGMSENIQAVSIVDRFLEHARVFIFCNGGDELMFISSADWMPRNLDGRVEVTAPIYDPGVKKQLRKVINIQLNGSAKARILDKDQANFYRYKVERIKDPLQSQIETYRYFQKALQKGKSQ